MTEKTYKLAKVRKPENAEDFTYFDIEEISEKDGADQLFENLSKNPESQEENENDFVDVKKFTIRHNADSVGSFFSRDDGEKLPIEISAQLINYSNEVQKTDPETVINKIFEVLNKAKITEKIKSPILPTDQ
jgi:hypothetical protein